MKTLKNKMKNKKGFTLMEMLIVVAIMVILVAVSVPVFANKLDDAKIAADDANLQAARSVALTQALVEDAEDGTYYYDAVSGTIITGTPDASYEGYGKQDGHNYIKVVITNGTLSDCEWQ